MVTDFFPSEPDATDEGQTANDADDFDHHLERIAGQPLHWVTAGSTGSPILLLHGFPETWRIFRRLIPLLATQHRVVAVDLPGFGESGTAPGEHSSQMAASALHELLAHLDLGPVHLSAQDISGNTAFRVACQHPDDVRSLTMIETLLSGFGFERLADVARGGAWHVGAIATPGIADFVFAGRMHAYLAERWFPFMSRTPDAVTPEDIFEFSRAYSRPGAWNGPQGLYASALRDGEEFTALAASHALRAPVLAVDGMGSASTARGMAAISNRLESVLIADVGHRIALEAPELLAEAILRFVLDVDSDA